MPQAVPGHSWLKRNIGAPLNRFNIKPGRHWDGVDRSNGFEREMFAEKNKMASLAREARAWVRFSCRLSRYVYFRSNFFLVLLFPQ